MTAAEVRYRYRHRAEVPEKARPRRWPSRERSTRKQAMNDLQRCLFDWLEGKDGPKLVGAAPAAQNNDPQTQWLRFVFKLGREGMACDPDGDWWELRRVWDYA